MTSAKETAAAVFERINRRRTDPAPASSGGTPPDVMLDHVPQPHAVRVRVDEVLFKNPAAGFTAGDSTAADGPSLRRPSAADPAADRFPRSATMRLILKHPALALGLGVPAAGLLLKSPASRRLLGMAVRVGTGPELQRLIRLTSGAAAASHPERPDPDKPAI